MRTDSITALFLIVISIFLYRQTAEFPSGAEIFPQLLLVLILVLSLILLVTDLRKARSKDGDKISLKSLNWRPYIFYAAMILYVLGIVTLGFFTSTVIFMVLVMLYLGIRKVSNYAIAVSGIVLFFYLLFVAFLHVPLPHGLVF